MRKIVSHFAGWVAKQASPEQRKGSVSWGWIRDLRTGYGPVCVTNFYRINILFTADHDLQTIFHVLGVYNPPEVMVVVVTA